MIAQPRLARAPPVRRLPRATTSASSGRSCSTPTGAIQSAGSYRNLGAPEWFDHRYRFKDADAPRGQHLAAGARRRPAPACTSSATSLDAIGALRRGATAWPTRTWTGACARWEAGWRDRTTRRAPTLTPPRVPDARRPSRASASSPRSGCFWQRWGAWFDERDVRTPDGALRDRLRDRGHRRRRRPPRHLRAPQPARASAATTSQLFSLGEQPDWFDLDVPVRTLRGLRRARRRARAGVDAIKVATWWNTGARRSGCASVRRGIPVFFVQDIETSLLPRRRARCTAHVLATYRPGVPLHDDLRLERATGCASSASTPTLVPPGHRPRRRSARCPDVAAPRRHAARARPHEPAEEPAADARRLARRSASRGPSCACSASSRSSAPRARRRATSSGPSDEEVNELFNEATVFVQTSTHEGFCLPPLEAMATGGAGRLHRRARQPRLLRRRRELPDARADGRVRVSGALGAAARRPGAARAARPRPASRRRPTTRGSGGSTSSRRSSSGSPPQRSSAMSRRRAVEARRSRATNSADDDPERDQQARRSRRSPRRRSARVGSMIAWRTCWTIDRERVAHDQVAAAHSTRDRLDRIQDRRARRTRPAATTSQIGCTSR